MIFGHDVRCRQIFSNNIFQHHLLKLLSHLLALKGNVDLSADCMLLMFLDSLFTSFHDLFAQFASRTHSLGYLTNKFWYQVEWDFQLCHLKYCLSHSCPLDFYMTCGHLADFYQKKTTTIKRYGILVIWPQVIHQFRKNCHYKIGVSLPLNLVYSLIYLDLL